VCFIFVWRIINETEEAAPAEWLDCPVPPCGTQVWLLVSRVRTAQGWREGVHFSLLPAVASEPGLPHRTRVEVLADALVVTVDKRARVRVPLPADARPSRVGVSSYTCADIEYHPGGRIANLSVAGAPSHGRKLIRARICIFPS
jgi:hypothetical protein